MLTTSNQSKGTYDFEKSAAFCTLLEQNIVLCKVKTHFAYLLHHSS
jgi:hypothetical protein